MDRELAQLRDELDRLHNRECELQKELFDVRAAAEIKRKQIDDFSKMRAVAAINRLPVEVFTRILHFALSMPHYSQWLEYGIQKQIYARVSRWWRDVILNSPSLWATICVCPHWASSFAEMHVARSGEHPLDIAVLQRWHEDNDVSFLGPILSCTRRWRSLTIRAGAPLTQFIRDLSGLYLPYLKSVNIQSYHDLDFEFPAADNTPALERLVLKPCRPAVTLLPSLGRLTTLALKGKIGHWKLRPQSIHLPLLRSLTIDVGCPSMLLQAIVAPGLSHFDASLRDVASLFREIPSVFNEVHHLCLRASTMCSVTGVCQAFPNVRQFEMEQLASMSFRYLQEDTDLWGGTEHVTFRSLRVKRLQEAVAGFREWIQLRKPMAKPLHVRFIDIKRCSSWNKTGRLLSMLYNSLHEDCTFEIDQFPLIEQTRVTLLNRALHMNLPDVPPCVVNMRSGKDISWHKSMEGFQNVSEYEPSDSEEEDSEEESSSSDDSD